MKGSTFSFLCVLVCACSKPTPETVSGGMPSFELTMLTGEKIMANTLPGKTILVFYNPDCDHCQREAAEIRRELDAFKGYKIYFIAASQDESIMQFARNYDLLDKANVLFATAAVPDVIREMGPMSSPSLYIYSDDRQLVKKFDGETPVEDIIRAL